MTDPVLWPRGLKPLSIAVNPVPATRSGGRTLGGLERAVRTDVGYWEIAYKGVPLGDVQRRRWWNALRTEAGGRAGLLEVPAWSFDTAPWPTGSDEGYWLTTHGDGTEHSDGTEYVQPAIDVHLGSALAIGATTATFTILDGIDDLSGVRFSYQGALYETGWASVSGGLWTARIFPAVRAPIPAGATLEFSRPTCLVYLATDRAMNAAFTRGGFDRVDVTFVEACAEWNDRAAA